MDSVRIIQQLEHRGGEIRPPDEAPARQIAIQRILGCSTMRYIAAAMYAAATLAITRMLFPRSLVEPL
jgi:hypothetical protein